MANGRQTTLYEHALRVVYLHRLPNTKKLASKAVAMMKSVNVVQMHLISSSNISLAIFSSFHLWLLEILKDVPISGHFTPSVVDCSYSASKC